MGRLGLVVALVALLAPASGAGEGRTLSAGGFTFSDDEGGFRLVAVSGSGTADEPFLVVEEIAGPGPAVLTITGFAPPTSTDSGVLRPLGISLRKIVLNLGVATWSRFTLELRERLDEPSDYYDGLSFDQMSLRRQPVRTDRFARGEAVHEPHDVVRFWDGVVRPGESVTFQMHLTDTSPRPTIYLIQMPDVPVAGLRPAPVGAAASGDRENAQ